jgi:hypothetical protein
MCYFYTQLLTSEVKLNTAVEWFTCTICLSVCLTVCLVSLHGGSFQQLRTAHEEWKMSEMGNYHR